MALALASQPETSRMLWHLPACLSKKGETFVNPETQTGGGQLRQFLLLHPHFTGEETEEHEGISPRPPQVWQS